MNKPKYLYKTEDQFVIFKFYSEGPKGRIAKIVEYTETATKGVFNLAFGDYDENTKTISDLTVTNNGDSLKVLATVASTVYAFFDKHPSTYVIATGSTNTRTRLYRMGITNNLAEIKEDFLVFGLSEKGNWEEFEVGEDYEAFLITKRL
jgi:hypothetical protein